MANTSHVSGTVLSGENSEDSDFESFFPTSDLPLPSLHSSQLLSTTSPKSTNPPHTTAAQQLLGKVIPDNTRKNNLMCLRSLCAFIVSVAMVQVDDVVEYGRDAIFPSNGGHLPPGYDQWTTDELKHIRYVLIEYVTNMRNSKTGKDLQPSTIKNYILGIQRAFRYDWGYDLKLLEGPIFNCPHEGLTAVLDNKARSLQEQGMHTTHHNVLSRTELVTLYKSASLSLQTPKGFQNCVIFTIGIVTAMRPTAMAFLKRHQFQKIRLDDDWVWKITGTVGSTSGSSKTSSGGWKSIGENPVEVCVWNEAYENGTINVFKIIDDYIRLRDKTAPES